MNASGKIDILLHLCLLVIWFMITRRLIILILRKQKDFFLATRFLNVFSAFMIIWSLSNIGIYSIKISAHQNTITEHPNNSSFTYLEARPDIYYIILDGYGRADILRDFYNFDNSEFLDYLTNKGFYIASKSHSNYAYTFLSLPSSLNLEFINYLVDKVGIESNDLRIPYEMIRNNRVAQFLKSKGYLFVHFNSTWGATSSNKYADIEIGYEKGLFNDEFLRVLSQTTVLKLFNSVIIEDLANSHLYTLKMLETIPDIKQPTFTFVHLLLPHHPYLFDHNGTIRHHATILDQFQSNMWEKRDEYIEQLIFVNNKIKSAVDTILNKSAIPPIIILQSDHGPHLIGENIDQYIEGRISILNAYYLPGGSHLLYNSITPVNTFRLIFDHYFGANYTMLDDVSYFSYFEQPYNFTLVSK